MKHDIDAGKREHHVIQINGCRDTRRVAEWNGQGENEALQSSKQKRMVLVTAYNRAT
jgi:hypothetical protein